MTFRPQEMVLSNVPQKLDEQLGNCVGKHHSSLVAEKLAAARENAQFVSSVVYTFEYAPSNGDDELISTEGSCACF